MTSYQPQSILVTGGAGFIGSNFIRYILSTHPHLRLINLDKLTYAGSLDNLADLPILTPQQYHFIQGDICDAALIKHILLHHEIDTIVHFAAESHVDRSIKNPSAFIETNVLGTFTLLEAAKHLWIEIEKRGSSECRFHHISTDEVFGSLDSNAPRFTETTAYQPRSPYSASKAGSDHLVQAYYHTYGLPITISNCSNNYGPYQHPEKFIPTVILNAIAGKTIPVYGNGKNIRDWLYVEDHCKAIMTILTKGNIGECYNVGGNNEWENLSLANHICKQLDSLLPQYAPHAHLLSFVSDRPGHDFRYAIDIRKINQTLEWSPEENIETGLQKTIAFYMKTLAL